MADKIKASEVSEVLLQQLKGISNTEKFDEVGTVLQVSDGVARIYGLRNAEANELLEFENGTMAIASKAKIEPGCEIVVPSKGPKDPAQLTQWLSIGTSAASLATMFVSIANMLK